MKKGSAKAVPAGKNCCRKASVCEKELAAVCVFSAACTSSDDHLQIRAHGWRTDRF